jgi:integrase
MARSGMQNGDLYLQSGFWKLRWREDATDANGSEEPRFRRPVWIGPATGPDCLTKEEAEQIAWENFLTRPEPYAREPQSAMTIGDFVEKVFVPEHVSMKKPAGRTHYQAILKHVLTPQEVDRAFRIDVETSKTRLQAVPDWPYLGSVRLCDVKPGDVQRLVTAASERGYSTQTVKHIRSVVSAIYVHARKKVWFNGDNPASQVALPGMTRKEAHALTLFQAKAVLGALQYPEREMALIAMITSMNVAEICGLQWKWVNLTREWSHADDERIPPATIAVRRQLYRGQLLKVTKDSRSRNLPIPDLLLPVLADLRRRTNFTGPDDFVLVSRVGSPIDEKSIAKRRLKPIGKDLQMPWLSWQVFRRTHKTLPYELGIQQFLKDGGREAGSTPVCRQRRLQLSTNRP